MDDPKATPRRRFQLHLSTCVVVMVMASALLWLNSRVSEVESRISAVHWIMQGRGFPFTFSEWQLDGSEFPYERFRWQYLVLDLFIAFTILTVFFFIAEGVSRRSQRNRTPEAPPHA